MKDTMPSKQSAVAAKTPVGSSAVTQFAAIDLGSNSFHLAIAEFDGHSLRVIGRIKQKVQLAAGLDANDFLSEESIQRGLDCLTLFAERIRDIDRKYVTVVGTYTLRKAKNASSFVKPAEQLLNHSLDILPGREEARLIYDGVSHNHPDLGRALVIDIGGGSTEIILGEQFEPEFMDSLSIGCVTSKKFFPDERITEENFTNAVINATIQISDVKKFYGKLSWENCLGASGSIEAIYKVLYELGLAQGFITFENLKTLRHKLIEIGDFNKIAFSGLTDSRKSTFPCGVAILYGLFETLDIDKMHIADASLREGILLELAEELKGNDIRHQTVYSLMNRFNIDQEHALQVKQSAQFIFDQIADLWSIYDPIYKNYLDWACDLHEIGLSISFSKLRMHSSYIIQYGDMPGFSQQTKDSLAAIVANQKKKLFIDYLDEKYDPQPALLAIVRILRLAILFNVKRDHHNIHNLKFIPQGKDSLLIQIPKDWADEHQLVIAELKRETDYLKFHQLSLNIELV
ncbi:Ppx/GppA phosphatase family protein [Kangiella sediminilitoris]|uniref:Ppx/GppA phosphatase n=1 Tax=Kangiella sediminilitoris TaxID=1144748 RepID=A0A1B3BBN8_9GAMM|nr:phosphatase [Kangiella sediminilitoris]AOE50206.1 Ppx/GppA phosphatase [Kangiella sediminilitoris]